MQWKNCAVAFRWMERDKYILVIVDFGLQFPRLFSLSMWKHQNNFWEFIFSDILYLVVQGFQKQKLSGRESNFMAALLKNDMEWNSWNLPYPTQKGKLWGWKFLVEIFKLCSKQWYATKIWSPVLAYPVAHENGVSPRCTGMKGTSEFLDSEGTSSALGDLDSSFPALPLALTFKSPPSFVQ